MTLKPHSKEWYLRLSTMQPGYYYPWKSFLPHMNGEDVYLEMVHELLAPDKDVLDGGCGHGELTLSFASHCRSILGYDRVPTYIDLAQQAVQTQNVGNARFILWDSSDDVHGKVVIPAQDHSFDLLISRRGPLNWLEDAGRVARPGAVLLQLNPIMVPAPPWNEELPEPLRFAEPGELNMRQAVEERLKIGGLSMQAYWTFVVPEVFSDPYQLYIHRVWGHTPEEVPGWEETRPILESIYARYGSPDGVSILHGRLLWRAVAPGTNISIRSFEWNDWNAMWQLNAYHLAESGITVDTIHGPPDLSILYDETDRRYHEMDMERIDEAYLKARGNFWIAWKDDQPLGYVGAQDYGDFIELRRMYVRKEFRQHGIGTLLVKVLIEHCIEKNVGSIELWTAGDGPGRPLYEKLGFRKIKPAGGEPEYAKRSSHEIRMRLGLPNLNTSA